MNPGNWRCWPGAEERAPGMRAVLINYSCEGPGMHAVLINYSCEGLGMHAVLIHYSCEGQDISAAPGGH